MAAESGFRRLDGTRRVRRRSGDRFPQCYDAIEYADLLAGIEAIVVAIAGAEISDGVDDWYEVLLRRAIRPAQIASVVETLITPVA